MTQTSENVTWLTQEAYNKLKEELAYLTGPARTEISAKIAAAREEGTCARTAGTTRRRRSRASRSSACAS